MSSDPNPSRIPAARHSAPEPSRPTPPPTPDADDVNVYGLLATPGDADYTAKDLEHLSDLEHVRERPSMYIADTTAAGCITWSTRWSTTRSTRPWPAMPARFP